MKNYNPIESFMKMLSPNICGEVSNSRKTAMTTEVNTAQAVVDTVLPFDTGIWETGISMHNDDWVIVEQYDSKKEAVKGHKKWVMKINKNPGINLKSIQ